MNDSILHQKNQLLQWILSLEDESVIKEIDELRKEILSKKFIAEPQTEYQMKDDFDERFAKGLSMEQSRARTKKFIESLPWKK